MLRKQHYWIFGSTALAALILLNLPERAVVRLKLAASSLFLPFFGLSQSGERLAEKGGAALVPRADLARENERLQKENQELRLRLAQAAETWRENQSLRQQLGWKNQAPWKMRLAHVTARDPANWWRTVQIDLGREDGIRPNFPVATAGCWNAGITAPKSCCWATPNAAWPPWSRRRATAGSSCPARRPPGKTNTWSWPTSPATSNSNPGNW
jgi:cell shape-determining protein MreC